MNTFRAVHLIGICGAGMQALVDYWLDLGVRLSGSDASGDHKVRDRLQQRGVAVQGDHNAENLPEDCELVIYSAAVPDSNPERIEANRRGLPEMSYVEVLGELSKQQTCVAVAGTHGKSSTTSMLAQILISAGRDPSVICGAESLSTQRSGRAGLGQALLLEACEFREHFLQFSPDLICLTGIELDHFDCYESLEDVETAFLRFLNRLPEQPGSGSGSGSQAVVVVRADCLSSARILQTLTVNETAERSSRIRVVSYGLAETADWYATGIVYGENTTLLVHGPGGQSAPLVLSVPGEHNVRNALAALATAAQFGLSLDEMLPGLQAFIGLKRRLEFKRKWHGAQVYDDYAHHPSEISASIQAVRGKDPGAKVVAVFQPHQLSRTMGLITEFADALSLADRVYLLPIFPSRERFSSEHVSASQKLLQLVKVPTGWISSLDQVWRTIQTDADENVVILTMGAGDLSRIHYELTD